MNIERWAWCGNCRLVLTPAEAEMHGVGYFDSHLPMWLRSTRNERWREMRVEQSVSVEGPARDRP